MAINLKYQLILGHPLYVYFMKKKFNQQTIYICSFTKVSLNSILYLVVTGCRSDSFCSVGEICESRKCICKYGINMY